MDQTVIQIPVEYRCLFDDDWREAAVYGGRYSLKSHTVARVLLLRARSEKTRVACFREYQNSISDSSHQLLSDLIEEYKMTDFIVTNNSIYNKITGSDFLFKGLHRNEQSIKSIEGIDIAWVEEAQTVSNKSLEVLTPTVRKPGSKIIYTYNRLLEDDPVHVRLVIEGRPGVLVLNLNYDIALKYGWMPDVIREEMEDDREKRPSLYRHKWLGEPNVLENRIYKDWGSVDEVLDEMQLVRTGLDFGYSNDPSAIVNVYKWNGAYVLDEVFYRRGAKNNVLADVLKESTDALTIGDSSEPKSIDEIRDCGVSIIGAKKGKDSVNYGIQIVQGCKIYVTQRSHNIWNEYKNYFWYVDKDGRTMNKPEGGMVHAMDAVRYAITSLHRTNKPKISYEAQVSPYLEDSRKKYIVPGLGVKATDYGDYTKAAQEYLN